MADYKRKHRSSFKSAPKMNKKKLKNTSNNIEMRPQNAAKPQKIKVVKGKKLEQKRRFKGLLYAVSILLVVFIAFQFILPAGVIETVTNSVAVLGAGKYPIELDSSDTLNVVSKGSYYYILTDTKLSAISNSGKVIYSYAHGFENPILKTSNTRALLFDQGKTEAVIFNLSGLKSKISSKKEIINAAIGANGNYALVTTADNYVSAVSVYKKNDKLIYEWFSSKEFINNVSLSQNGNKIAVSLLSSAVGNYNSNVCILNFKSANAEYSRDYKNTIVYSLDSSSGGFSVVTENSYEFISWRGKNVTQYSNEYSVDMIRPSSSGTVLVLNRESDKTDNRIAIFSKNGKLKTQLEYKGIITDIAIRGGSVYCLSDTNILILNNQGNVLRKAMGGFGVQRISVIGQNKVVTVTDNLISDIKLK